MTGLAGKMPDLADVVLEDDRWQAADLAALATRAFGETLGQLGLDPGTFEIAVLACDDARIAELNREFREKPVPTNVLSWPSDDLSPDCEGGQPLPPDDAELGDIAIAFETCQAEARDQDKEFNDHVTHLLVHGCLHLLGYDHVSDKDATLMEGLEVEILAKLGIANPY
jgi:probable rRNA maturation factor